MEILVIMLDIYYQNVQGLRTKTNDLLSNVLTSNYRVIALTETWLNGNICDNEIIDNRYITYRRDRDSSSSNKKEGGGVMLAVSRDIPSVREYNWETNAEDLWVTLKVKVNRIIRKLAICVVYLPPPIKLETLSRFLENLESIADQCDDLVILGDFNLGFIHWDTRAKCSQMFPSNYSTILGHTFIDFISTNNLYQLNSVSNSDGRFLDLILCSFLNATVTSPLSNLISCNKYHPSLLLSLFQDDIDYLRPKVNVRYNFYKANYESIIIKLKSINWLSVMSYPGDVNLMVAKFYEVLDNVIEEFVPKKKTC